MTLENIKKIFLVTITFFSCNPLNVNSSECVSMNNQECKIRAKKIDINNNESVFYPFSIKVNKCSEVVIISIIRMLNCVFLMLLKI